MTHQGKKQYLEEVVDTCKKGIERLQNFEEVHFYKNSEITYFFAQIKLLDKFPTALIHNLTRLVINKKQREQCETIFIFASLMAEKLLKELQEPKYAQCGHVPITVDGAKEKGFFTCDFAKETAEKEAEKNKDSKQATMDRLQKVIDGRNKVFEGLLISSDQWQAKEDEILELSSKLGKAKRKLKKIKKRLESARDYAIESTARVAGDTHFWEVFEILKIKF